MPASTIAPAYSACSAGRTAARTTSAWGFAGSPSRGRESAHLPVAEVEAQWAQEIGRRVAAFDKGELPDYPAEDVFAEARRLLRSAERVGR